MFLPLLQPDQLSYGDYTDLLNTLGGATLTPAKGYAISTEGSVNCAVSVNKYNAAEAGDTVTVK